MADDQNEGSTMPPSPVATPPTSNAALTPSTVPTGKEVVLMLVLDYLMDYLDRGVHPARLRWKDGVGMVHFNIWGQKDLSEDDDVTRSGLVWSPDLLLHPARVIRGISPRCAIAAEPHIWRHVWLIQDHDDLQRTIVHLKDAHSDLAQKLRRYTKSVAYVHWPKGFLNQASLHDRWKTPFVTEWKEEPILLDWMRDAGRLSKDGPAWPIETMSCRGSLTTVAWLTEQVGQAWARKGKAVDEKADRHLILCSSLLANFYAGLINLVKQAGDTTHISLDLRRGDPEISVFLCALWRQVTGRLTLLTNDMSLRYEDRLSYWDGTDAASDMYQPSCSKLVTNDTVLLGQCLLETTLMRIDVDIIKIGSAEQQAKAFRLFQSLGHLRSSLKSHLDAHTDLRCFTAEEILKCLDPRTGHTFAAAVQELKLMAHPMNTKWLHIGRQEAQEIADAFNSTLPPLSNPTGLDADVSELSDAVQNPLKRKASDDADETDITIEARTAAEPVDDHL